MWLKLDDLTLLASNEDVRHRIETFWTKEPETVRWLDTFSPDDVFYDVGANIGLYTLWGSRRCRTFAFEPHAANFALLNTNVQINNLSSQITAYCCSISDKPSIDLLHCHRTDAGASFSSFGEAVDDWLCPIQFPFVQGSISIALDWAASLLPQPTHIKIDVDGLEHKVVDGGMSCLAACKSVMIELNRTLQEHVRIFDLMNEWGFRIILEQGDNETRTILFSR